MAMAFADLLNQAARALEADGVEWSSSMNAFNVYMSEVKGWGIRGTASRDRRTKVHDGRAHLLRLRHQGDIDWKNSLGAEWRQYEEIFPALAKSRIDQARSNASTLTCQ